MEIILAKSAGFCFGVHRAVDMAFKTEEDKKTYTLGHIIHNETVTRKLKQKGRSLGQYSNGKSHYQGPWCTRSRL